MDGLLPLLASQNFYFTDPCLNVGGDADFTVQNARLTGRHFPDILVVYENAKLIRLHNK